MKLKKKVFIVFFCSAIFLQSLILGESYILHESAPKLKNSASDIQSVAFEWYKTWSASNHDSGKGITVDNFNNIFITGEVGSFSDTNDDIFLLYLNNQSNFQWSNIWGTKNDDYSDEIVCDNLGNIYVVGTSGNYLNERSDIIISKFNSSGIIQWSKKWGEGGHNWGRGIDTDTLGNIYITGITDDHDLCIVKLDNSGNIEWNQTYGGSGNDYCEQIVLDDSGNLYVIGTTYSYGLGDSNIYLLKLNNSGDLEWYTTWGGTHSDYGEGIVLDNLGNIFIVGTSTRYQNGFYSHLLLIKFNNSGNLLWNNSWGVNDRNFGEKVAIDTNGNLYVLGNTRNDATGNYNICVLKFDKLGNPISEVIWGGFSDEYGWNLAFDYIGNLYIIGSTESYSHDYNDLLILKYGVDSDDDGLCDNHELNIYFTNFNVSDSDNDGLSDGDEVLRFFTDPNKSDTDGDGYSDYDEIFVYKTDPKNFFSNIGMIIGLALFTFMILMIIGFLSYITIKKRRNFQ